MASLYEIYKEIEKARRANDTVRVAFLLENENVSDFYKKPLVYNAAKDDNNGAPVLRLLWNALSEKQQQEMRQDRTFCPLCDAVGSGSQEKLEFFADECHFDVNKKDFIIFRTPLVAAVGARRNAAEMCRLLVERGADLAATDYLQHAIQQSTTRVVRLFLEEYNLTLEYHHASEAISTGKGAILQMLLQHGGPVTSICWGQTSLNRLLSSDDHPRITKLNISRILIRHANSSSNHANSERMMGFIFTTLAATVMEQDHCAILVAAGMDPAAALYEAVAAKNIPVCRWLVQNHGANPFQEGIVREYSPFRLAAGYKDTTILELFLPLWPASSTNGVNSKGNNFIHEICYDIHCEDKDVKLEAVRAILGSFEEESNDGEEEESKVLSALLSAPNHEGYTPVLLAAKEDAGLDVIYELLKKDPTVLTNNIRPSKDALDAQIASLRQDKKMLQATVISQQARIEQLEEAARAADNVQEPAKKKAKTNY